MTGHNDVENHGLPSSIGDDANGQPADSGTPEAVQPPVALVEPTVPPFVSLDDAQVRAPELLGHLAVSHNEGQITLEEAVREAMMIVINLLPEGASEAEYTSWIGVWLGVDEKPAVLEPEPLPEPAAEQTPEPPPETPVEPEPEPAAPSEVPPQPEPEPTPEPVPAPVEQPPVATDAMTPEEVAKLRQSYIEAIIADLRLGTVTIDRDGRPTIGNSPLARKGEEESYRSFLRERPFEKLREEAERLTRNRLEFERIRSDKQIQAIMHEAIIREGLLTRQGVLSVTADSFDFVMGRMFEVAGHTNAEALLTRLNYARQALGMTRNLEFYTVVVRQMAAALGIKVVTGTERLPSGIHVRREEVINPDQEYPVDQMQQMCAKMITNFASITRSRDLALAEREKSDAEVKRLQAEVLRLSGVIAQRDKDVAELQKVANVLGNHPLVPLADTELQFVIRHNDHPDRYIGLTEGGKQRRREGKQPVIFDYVPVRGLGRALKMEDLIEARGLIDWIARRPYHRRVNLVTTVRAADGTMNETMNYSILRLAAQDYQS